VSIIQVVDTIIVPLLRQLSRIARPMPGGRRRRDTKGLTPPQAQDRRLGRQLPRKPHRRMILFTRFPWPSVPRQSGAGCGHDGSNDKGRHPAGPCRSLHRGSLRDTGRRLVELEECSRSAEAFSSAVCVSARCRPARRSPIFAKPGANLRREKQGEGAATGRFSPADAPSPRARSPDTAFPDTHSSNGSRQTASAVSTD
jgi:hypothetical protein